MFYSTKSRILDRLGLIGGIVAAFLAGCGVVLAMSMHSGS